jgi:DNA-binding response OmpR family regulator
MATGDFARYCGVRAPRRRRRLIRFVCRTVLELAGLDVIEAADGEEGLAAVAARRPDVVLLDEMMPGLNGLEVAQRLLAAADAPPIVLISARAGRDDQLSGFEAGAVDYITKPFDPVAFTDRVVAAAEAGRGGGADELRRSRLSVLLGTAG